MNVRRPRLSPEQMSTLVKWLAFGGVSVLLGLAWLAPLLMIYSGESTTQESRRDLLWTGLSGLFFGVAYAAIRGRRTTELSAWWALLMPACACTIRSLTEFATTSSDYVRTFAVQTWGFTLLSAYTCAAMVILPLAILHLVLLKRAYHGIGNWTAAARPRAIRKALIALSCMALIVATEAPRLLEGFAYETPQSIARRTQIVLPGDAQIVATVYGDQQTREDHWWIGARRIDLDRFNVKPMASDVTEPEGVVIERAIQEVGIDATRVTSVSQMMWSVGGEKNSTARVVHTIDGDYAEISYPRFGP